jgi:hypothetical protein
MRFASVQGNRRRDCDNNRRTECGTRLPTSAFPAVASPRVDEYRF